MLLKVPIAFRTPSLTVMCHLKANVMPPRLLVIGKLGFVTDVKEVLEVVEEDQTEKNDVGTGDNREDWMRERNKAMNKN